MKDAVTIVDDTLRRTVMLPVTPQMRLDFARAGRPIPDKTLMLPAVDSKGHRVLEVVESHKTYEGAHLAHAVRRAKRFMRSRGFREEGRGAPRHIAHAMLALYAADREAFDRAMA